MSKCIYCKCDLVDDRAVSVCDRCGHNVWGEKMFGAIKDSMSNAREKGNLNQGLITIQDNTLDKQKQ